MRRKVRKMDCIEYLSVQAPLEKVNMLEDKQSKYIHDFAKKSEYCIVGKMRRNGFSQRDVDRQWMQIVNMIRKKQIKGVVVANMAAVSSSVADAYYKVGLINEAGGVVVTVDEGRLEMKIKEVSLLWVREVMVDTINLMWYMQILVRIQVVFREESDLVSLFPVMQVTTTELHRYRLFH